MKYLIVSIVLIALAFPPAVSAAVWYVDTNVVGGTHTGSSWTDAFSDLQAALASASSPDEIWVAAGRYLPTAGSDRAISFVIPAGVSVYGGFAGAESGLNDRDWHLNPTVLSGDIQVSAQVGDNSYNVVALGANATLDGFTVRDGNGDGPSNDWRSGAGIFTVSDGVTVRNCQVIQNQTAAGGKGAGLYSSGDDLLVEDCEFSENHASGSFSAGGGAYAAWGETKTNVFRRVVFRNNSAGEEGGGLFQGSLAEDCNFLDNQSVRTGGGTHWVYVVTNCYYEGNSSLGGGGTAYGSLIQDSDFNSNSADTGGGIYAADVVQRCVVYGNSAEDGGGVYLSIGAIHNSVLFDNTATNTGGGMYGVTGTPNNGTATNLTIANNTAGVAGGGIAGVVDMANSIVWGNQSLVDPTYHLPAVPDTAHFSYSLLEGSGGSGLGWTLDAADQGSNIDEDPLFAAPDLADFQIGPNSPAFNAGDNTLVVGAYDAEGDERIQNITVDMGAYEVGTIIAVPDLPSPQSMRAFPNPFNPSVTIEFALSSNVRATVKIYDVAGRVVRTLWDGPGSTLTRLKWDGTDDADRRVGTGVYFVRLLAASRQEEIKLVMVK